MKYLFFLLSLCTPFVSTAGWGIELLGGTNMNIGPIDRNMMDKGSKPGWTGVLKVGGYFKKIDFGIGVETGTWKYTKQESGYPLYDFNNYNYSNPYGYRLGDNSYSSTPMVAATQARTTM